MNLYTVAKLNRLCRKYDLGRLIAQVTYESGMECRLTPLPPDQNNDSSVIHESHADDLDSSDRDYFGLTR
jgi:hypothetical protein